MSDEVTRAHVQLRRKDRKMTDTTAVENDAYAYLRRLIDEDHKRRVADLDRLFALTARDGKPLAQLIEVPASQPRLTACVREAVARLDCAFDINVIIHEVRQRDPHLRPNKTSVSGILRKLAAEGRVVVVSTGAGPYPAFYRRAA
jgi:hypothetical protein